MINLDKKVIIAGIPRSGTTYIFRAICGQKIGDKTPLGGTFEDGYYRLGKLIKTHAYDFKTPESGYKALFLFSDIFDSIISTKEKRYNKRHFLNCRSTKNPKEVDIFKHDYLNYELIFDNWYKHKRFPVMAIRYETMGKYFNEIQEFLGFKINFPPFQPRIHYKINEDVRKTILSSYGKLHEKIELANEIRLFD
jgi:hypothetical protein